MVVMVLLTAPVRLVLVATGYYNGRSIFNNHQQHRVQVIPAVEVALVAVVVVAVAVETD